MEKIYFCIEKEKDDTPGFRESWFNIVIITKDKIEYQNLRANYQDQEFDNWYFRYQDHVMLVENADEIINNIEKYKKELLDCWDFARI